MVDSETAQWAHDRIMQLENQAAEQRAVIRDLEQGEDEWSAYAVTIHQNAEASLRECQDFLNKAMEALVKVEYRLKDGDVTEARREIDAYWQLWRDALKI